MAKTRRPPADFVENSGYFPYGPFKPEAPREVYLAAGLAARLTSAIGEDSVRYIAKMADLSPQTILNILNGKSWPDLRTIARLEIVFDYRLWGYEHRRHPEYFYRNKGLGGTDGAHEPRRYLPTDSPRNRFRRTKNP